MWRIVINTLSTASIRRAFAMCRCRSLSVQAIPTGTNLCVTVDPLGRFAYVANYTDDLSAYRSTNNRGLTSLLPVAEPSSCDRPPGKCPGANNTSNDVMSYTIDSGIGDYDDGDCV